MKLSCLMLATLLSISVVYADDKNSKLQAQPTHKNEDFKLKSDGVNQDLLEQSRAHNSRETGERIGVNHTAEIHEALMAGGEPIAVDVLGVVCDFCAIAMNKVFKKQKEVAAVYVDLDTKILSIVTQAGETLGDSDIEYLAEQAGYRIAEVRRGQAAL